MTLNRIIVGLGAFGASSLAWGQDITWGPLSHSVPLSPMLTTLIAIMLLVATYAFMKRHAGAGIGAMVIASLLGIATVNEDVNAFVADYTIATSSGSEYLCDRNSAVELTGILPLVIGTSVNPGVRIISANPIPTSTITNGKDDVKVNINGYPDCAAGLELYKDKSPSYCYLWCIPG